MNTTKNITIFTGNYAPEDTAIGLYTSQFATFLSNKGYAVSVITGFPYYPQWKIAENYCNKNTYFNEIIDDISGPISEALMRMEGDYLLKNELIVVLDGNVKNGILPVSLDIAACSRSILLNLLVNCSFNIMWLGVGSTVIILSAHGVT